MTDKQSDILPVLQMLMYKYFYFVLKLNFLENPNHIYFSLSDYIWILNFIANFTQKQDMENKSEEISKKRFFLLTSENCIRILTV